MLLTVVCHVPKLFAIQALSFNLLSLFLLMYWHRYFTMTFCMILYLLLCTCQKWRNKDVQSINQYEKLHLCPFWCYFTGIPVCVYISYNAHERCSKETSFKWSDVYVNLFCTEEYTKAYYWNQSEKLCFEPSQIATVTNCDKSGIFTVAICNLPQFVIKTVPWQTQSSNIENVFCVLGRLPVFSFDMNLRDCVWPIFALFAIYIVNHSPNFRCRNEPRECV